MPRAAEQIGADAGSIMEKRIRIIRKFFLYSGLAVMGMSVFLFVLFRYLHFSTNSAAIYFLKDDSGFRISTDITFNEIDSLVFRIDATGLFNRLFETVSAASDRPVLDVRYDTDSGKGLIKEFRPDGSRLEISLSRFDEDGIAPAGLIIGGDFPPGDAGVHREGGGMAFYDGSQWIHLWCTANEGIASANGGTVYEPHKWTHLSSRILKRSFEEVILESNHTVSLVNDPVSITRRIHAVAGDNYVTLTIKITNSGKKAILYDYAYGDEPWIGRFGTSEGEVGWHEDGLVVRETFLDPHKYSLIGFADIGNVQAGETGEYSQYANFIQWIDTIPSQVYFSNDFYYVRNRVLDSRDNRVLNVVWKEQYLAPGESNSYHLRIGFVPPGENLFEKGRVLARQ